MLVVVAECEGLLESRVAADEKEERGGEEENSDTADDDAGDGSA